MSSPEILTFAFCICDDVTLSDFIPPSEIIGNINAADTPFFPPHLKDTAKYRVKFDYLAPEKTPPSSILGPSGARVAPTKTYEEATKEGIQYDVLFVPAGPLPDPVTGKDRTNKEELAFIAAQAPKAKYILSVCGGSAILAAAGVLSGRRATTNKSAFKMVEAMSPKDITWVAKARWVVDGNIWTSSGVTAGTDMAVAFVEHLFGKEIASFVRGGAEIIEHGMDDDPFAAFHGHV
ncbi:class I glutamine amidotransferase-like protein [Cylindrobasidium torrendii FP15055 ss-10]|uniref:Class I glutamine amidotransferase-like protein n=1 Tax=Cylindrobasidium torrendii FP15055 ss-10 TaxID=1314674 RepID=A0A0D7B8L4_9AGAR|nr:class I glutamine amidotransferase-like protein [Cylindrobasidium torrendii FP15055 ss-10]